MEVKPGYKQTEVGVIPEDWDSTRLGGFIALQRGHDITWRDRRSGDVPVMGAAGHNGFHDTAIAKGPGVVLGRAGASFGQAHYCEHDFWPHNTALYVTDFRSNDPLFVFYFLTSIDFSRYNSGGAQPMLNRNFISPIIVGVPQPTEQRAIAAALSDVDALLDSLDRLIAKKRDLKQAAMQQLLTGQTRLPGFHCEWEVKRLDEVGQCFAGGTPSTTRPDYWGGDVFWLPSGRVQNNILHAPSESEVTITQRGLAESAAKSIKPRSVLIAITGATCANVALLHFAAAANQSVVAVEPFNSADARFLYYSLLMERGQILSRQSGSAQGGVNLKTVKGIEIRSPELPEQTAIAAVLTEMDQELAALEQRQAKTRALKQGMMQELLTGRTRLV